MDVEQLKESRWSPVGGLDWHEWTIFMERGRDGLVLDDQLLRMLSGHSSTPSAKLLPQRKDPIVD